MAGQYKEWFQRSTSPVKRTLKSGLLPDQSCKLWQKHETCYNYSECQTLQLGQEFQKIWRHHEYNHKNAHSLENAISLNMTSWWPHDDVRFFGTLGQVVEFDILSKHAKFHACVTICTIDQLTDRTKYPSFCRGVEKLKVKKFGGVTVSI